MALQCAEPLNRHAVVLRFAPWWFSVGEFGGRARELVVVPRGVYDRMPPPVQLLYRHAEKGVDDFLQLPKQIAAQRAKFRDQPALRGYVIGDNSHIVVRFAAEGGQASPRL